MEFKASASKVNSLPSKTARFSRCQQTLRAPRTVAPSTRPATQSRSLSANALPVSDLAILDDVFTGATLAIFLLSSTVGATFYYFVTAFGDDELRDPFIDHED